MKIGDYITSSDWNSLSLIDQSCLVSYLRFIGHRVLDAWVPPLRINNTSVVFLDRDGDLIFDHAEFIETKFNRLSLYDVHRIISLGIVE